MATLEIVDRFGRGGRHHTLSDEHQRVTLGRSDTCDLVLDEDDTTVSRFHAILVRVGIRWAINDTDSANGTFVNRARVVAEQILHDGDEIKVGETRLLYRNGSEKRGRATDPIAPPPKLTPKQFETLRELVRPVLLGNKFTPPASTREIADRMFVGEAAVKNHLLDLYAKFAIDEGPNRRERLAAEAYARGAVGIGDVLDEGDDPGSGS